MINPGFTVTAPEIRHRLFRKSLTRLPEQKRRMKRGRHYCNHVERTEAAALGPNNDSRSIANAAAP
jgi:hypothetical protein